MKIKVITIIGTVFIAVGAYLLEHTFDNAYRDMGFETQVEPTFYQRQIVDELKTKETLVLPKGVFVYTYEYAQENLIKTIWTFNADDLNVKGYLISNPYSNTADRNPDYTAQSKVRMNGQVLVFEEIIGDAGLLPKYGLAFNSYTKEGINLETSDGSERILFRLN